MISNFEGPGLLCTPHIPACRLDGTLLSVIVKLQQCCERGGVPALPRRYIVVVSPGDMLAC